MQTALPDPRPIVESRVGFAIDCDIDAVISLVIFT